jgi:hypothetical protein
LGSPVPARNAAICTRRSAVSSRTTISAAAASGTVDAAVAAERLEHSDGGALFHKTYRHLYEGENRTQANRLQTLVLDALDDEGTADGEAPCEGRNQADSEDGRYWARTSDPQLVDPIAGVTSASVLFGLVPSNPLAKRDRGRLRPSDGKRRKALPHVQALRRHCAYF